MTQLDPTAERVRAFAEELTASGADQLDLARALTSEGAARLMIAVGIPAAAAILTGHAERVRTDLR